MAAVKKQKLKKIPTLEHQEEKPGYILSSSVRGSKGDWTGTGLAPCECSGRRGKRVCGHTGKEQVHE